MILILVIFFYANYHLKVYFIRYSPDVSTYGYQAMSLVGARRCKQQL